MMIQNSLGISLQELTTICDDLIAKVGTWQHHRRDYSRTRTISDSRNNSNLGTGNSKSQSHLDSGTLSRDRPTLQRQGTFTETRKSRPHSAEYSDYREPYTPSTTRPVSGPPQTRSGGTNRTELRKSFSSSENRQSGSRLARQTSDSSRPRLSGSSSSTRPHSHCYTRTSPSPTFTRKYRGSPNRGRIIWRSLTF